MNLTQNDRLKRVTSDTLIVGVDVGSKAHFSRAFDWRGFELSRRVFKFSNEIWHDGKVRAAEMKRPKTLVEATQNSVGLEEYLEGKVKEVPNVEKLPTIKGVGLSTVIGSVA